MAALDAAIIGGGPAGLATAHALHKTLPPGARIAVFERAPRIDIPRGAGLGLEVNGLRALRAIDQGVFDEVMSRHAVSIATSDFRDPQGGVIRSSDTAAVLQASKEKHGLHAVQMGWHELNTTLAARLPPDVEVHTGCRFLRYEEVEGGRLRLYFEGKPAAPVTASLLVAADGYFSNVRRQCVGDGPPDFGGNLVWRARLSSEEAEKHGYPRGKVVWYFGANRMALVFGITGGDVVWTASVTEAELEKVGIDWREVTAGRLDTAAQSADYLTRSEAAGLASRERVLRCFQGYESPLLGLMADTRPEAIVEHGLFVRPAADIRPEWFGKGRVVVLGDAAHPLRPTGQGTNQALEDAHHLGRLIQEAGGQVDDVLLDKWRLQRYLRVGPIMASVEAQGKAAYRADARAATSNASTLERGSMSDRPAGPATSAAVQGAAAAAAGPATSAAVQGAAAAAAAAGAAEAVSGAAGGEGATPAPPPLPVVPDMSAFITGKEEDWPALGSLHDRAGSSTGASSDTASTSRVQQQVKELALSAV
eukprot:CAMPEP_0202921240 /NCGR_PEP_ID=MMETSP1392-20130828/77287_1 /ASSEMBLY_ACC=CAM_ASM_000868 /TAXON_ID=225041 /ORGANISM="Chlamydomonas chlamydogama, Strain SAG 11-48b" /LENGTH=534 /DNA_ID=CAMNT_0049614793 /DNA_START=106 /DNA_END=1710 /DNA_ORIENTATION=-